MPPRKVASASSRVRRPSANISDLVSNPEIWPTERDVLMRPDRLKYVRKLVRPKGCVFCHAARFVPGMKAPAGETNLLLAKSENAMVVMNKYPYNNGHLLILPTRHCGDLLELSETELNELGQWVRNAVAALRDCYGPAGFNVGYNLGAASGAGIPDHLHCHVIPRWNGDTNFFPLIAETKVVVETLEQSYSRLLPYFQDLMGRRKSAKAPRRVQKGPKK